LFQINFRDLQMSDAQNFLLAIFIDELRQYMLHLPFYNSVIFY
jgi:hypothetical protein